MLSSYNIETILFVSNLYIMMPIGSDLEEGDWGWEGT